MSSEIRQIVDQSLSIQQSLRDQQIGLVGTSVKFDVPTTGTTPFDDFGDIKTSPMVSLYTEIIIKWGDYRSSLSVGDLSTEQGLPLFAIAKLKDNIPKGSTVYLSYLDIEGNTVNRTFEVNGVDLKIENLHTTKILKLVPIRT
jgi:hypothetical protein